MLNIVSLPVNLRLLQQPDAEIGDCAAHYVTVYKQFHFDIAMKS